MNVGSENAGAGNEPMMEMNMTPLIDVMLVLIIMLIITIPIQNHAVDLNMPVPSTSLQTKLPQIEVVDIAADGTILWNGSIVADKALLQEKLEAVARQEDQHEVHVRPNKMVPYKAVAAVLAAAQRSGVIKLGIVGNEQYLNQ